YRPLSLGDFCAVRRALANQNTSAPLVDEPIGGVRRVAAATGFRGETARKADEKAEFLGRGETTQRLPCCGCLCGGGLAANPGWLDSSRHDFSGSGLGYEDSCRHCYSRPARGLGFVVGV